MANGNDQYDLRRQKRNGVTQLDPNNMQTAMEIMGLSPDLIAQALESAGTVYDRSMGTPEEFSEQDQRALDTLTGRAKRLEPSEAPAPIQGILPGNEYAVNFRGLSQGLQNLVTSYVNRGKEAELYGDAKKTRQLEGRAADKIKKAKELRQMAKSLEQAGPAIAPGFDPQSAVREMIADAEALEEAAAQDQRAAENTRGVLQKAKRLEEQKAEALADEEERSEFVRKYGLETYQQALRGEREERDQQAVTERERLRQKGITERNKANIKYGLEKARIQAQSKSKGKDSDDNDYPYYAQPEYVQEFVKTYMGPIEQQIEALEDRYIDDLTGPDPTMPAAEKQRLQTLRQQQALLREINLDAITYGQLQEDGFTKEDLDQQLRPPTADERATMLWMQRTGMPPEMIDAWKFYNRISLNIAPQGPSSPGPGDPSDMSGAFREEGFGTGEFLKRPENSNNQNE